MPELMFEGLRASYRVWGSGPAILLLHSGGSSGAQWTRVAEALSTDHQLVAPDLLGFGATQAWPVAGALTHDLQADLAAAVMRAASDRPMHVVGHSYGGACAIRLLMRHPALVRSLVLVEPIIGGLLREAGDPLYERSTRVGTLFIESVRAGEPERGWEAFIDSRNGAGTWSRLSDQARARFIGQSVQTMEAFISNRRNPTSIADCRAIGVPATVVCGAAATPDDRRVSEILRDAIPGCRYVVIENAGHMSPLTHPEAVARIIENHVGIMAATPG